MNKPLLPTLVALALLNLPAAAQPPADPLERALEAASQGDYEQAIEILEILSGREGVEPLVVSTLGAFYLEVGRPAAALKILRPLAERDDANAAVLYNAGRAALATGMTEIAEHVLARSVALMPGSPAARELGLLRGARQEFSQAYRLLKPWALQHPEDAEARLAAALCAVRLERVPDAEELLAGLPADHPRVRLLTAQVAIQKGEPLQAIAAVEPVLDEAPPETELDLRRTIAEAYAMSGQAAQAVATLEGHVRGEPSLALQLARAHFQQGEVQKALDTLDPHAARLLELGREAIPEVARGLASEISREHGRFLVNVSRFEEAVPLLQLATELDPAEKQAWYALGQAMAGSGRADDAQAALERFQELSAGELSPSANEQKMLAELKDPTGREVIRGFQMLAEGRIQDALTLAQTERDLAPTDPRPRFLEARALLMLERTEEAQAVADTLVAGLPENPDARYLRGAARMARRDLPGAEADLRQALEIAPEHLGALNDLAVLLLETERAEEARGLLERVLELRPGDPLATENLAKLP